MDSNFVGERSERLIQWNCQGISTSKEDLIKLIDQYKPLVIAIQETFLGNNFMINLPGYNAIVKQGHYNNRFHGGVVLFIHNECPYTTLDIDSQYQVVAARVSINRIQCVTVASVYIPGREAISVASMNALLDTLPQPRVLLGDFNAHHSVWGAQRTTRRGEVIEQLLSTRNLNILNDGSPTHTSGTSIDLSLVSPVISTYASWSVYPSPLSSDHHPIIVTLDGDERGQLPESYNMKRAKWSEYCNDEVWKNLEIPPNFDPNELVDVLYEKFQGACERNIPKFQKKRFHPKPWWSAECSRVWRRREWLYRKYKETNRDDFKLQWKRARAVAKLTFRKAKQNSWIEFVSTLSERTPSSIVWDRIRKIKGRPPKKVNILYDDGVYFESVNDVVNKLAETFETITSSANYSPDFTAVKQREESDALDFSSNCEEEYNAPITIDELMIALDRNLDTAMGSDNISYHMIKNMPSIAHQYLLKIFNKIFTSSTLHERWRHAIIVPIAKPGKDHSNPSNYRPISLTSNLCKTLESIINRRMVEHLEKFKLLSNIQCGFRKHRSTIDHLVRFENYVKQAYANNKYVTAVFFDLEKAYDLTWRYGITRDMHRIGFRGYLPKFIGAFLRNRTFQVKLNHILSEHRVQETGVPQGSTLSVTLFAIKIDSLTQVIPTNVFSSLFVDDVQIAFSHHSHQTLMTTLQGTVDSMLDWARDNGFRFSPAKTNAMSFLKRGENLLQADLKMNGVPIRNENNVKFLGLNWDPKLSWEHHVSQLKTSCQKSLNLLRSVSAHGWGADQETLLRLYRSLIRSKLDYGCIVYGSASKHILQSLDTVASEAIRIATGAFKSSPVDRLHIIANEPTLENRRAELTLRYFFKLKSHFMNPAYNCVNNSDLKLFFRSRPNSKTPIIMRIDEAITKYNLPVQPVLPYRTPTLYSWSMKCPEVDLRLTRFQKATTPANVMRGAFYDHVSTTYRNRMKIFTDGSKTEDGVGAAAVLGGVTRRSSLPPVASIYTAELYALKLAVQIIEERPAAEYVICTDSLSSVQSVSSRKTKEHLVQRLQEQLHTQITRGCSITILWTPSHCDIRGNERADREAKAAAARMPEFIPVPYTDWYKLIRSKCRLSWREEWMNSGRHLVEIKSEPGKWNSKGGICRRDEVVINRLRLGHTNLTHSYLFDPAIQRPMPPCELCGDAAMTVKHVLLECENLRRARNEHLAPYVGGPLTLNSVIGEEAPLLRLIEFLRVIGAYNRI